jgi:hypothetical protein
MMKLAFASLAVTAAHAANWTVDRAVTDTILFGVSFVGESTGYLAGADSGSGNFIKETTDGGQTFQDLALGSCNPSIMLDVMMGDATTGVTSGLGIGSTPTCVTSDGTSFKPANEKGLVVTCQSAELIQGSQGIQGQSFGLTGSFGKTNGVSTSTDGGVTWTNRDISEPTGLLARYGSFPSATTWYVAAGDFPTNNTKSRDHSYFYSNAKDGKFTQSFFGEKSVGDAGWGASIMKTTDGGKTWAQVFNDTGRFYFNQISCFNEQVCTAVGEGESSTFTGAAIYGTSDGGATWKQQHYGDSESILAVRMISATEAWVGGTYAASQLKLASRFYHTTDTGATWTVEGEIPQVAVTDMNFISATSGWATAIVGQQSTMVRYN